MKKTTMDCLSLLLPVGRKHGTENHFAETVNRAEQSANATDRAQIWHVHPLWNQYLP